MSSGLDWIAGRSARSGARPSWAEGLVYRPPACLRPLGRLGVFGPHPGGEDSTRSVSADKCGSAAAHAVTRIEQFEHATLDRRACLPGIIWQVVEIHDLAFR